MARDDYSPERIADRMQIQDCIYRWCRAVDRLDYEGMRASFHPDAVDKHGAFDGDINGLVEWIRARHAAIPFSMHALDQLAGGRAGSGVGAMDLLTCSRYVDRFERRDGEWKIALRTLVADWKQFVEVPQGQPKPPASQEVGRRNDDDFIYRERRALGIS
ncbi:MAG: nuclear transport factor 2 family protein [Frateuria sp.]|nr:nuclear transport factor 2 family protein [Frateuria sp.]